MKKTIILCTVVLCSVICATGYFIACSCGNGANSTPTGYIDLNEALALLFFSAVAVVSLFFAIKDLRDHP